MKKRNFVSILIFELFLFSSCQSQTIKIELSPVNPTSYDFHNSMKEVNKAIRDSLRYYQFKNAVNKEGDYSNLTAIFKDDKYAIIHNEQLQIIAREGNSEDAIMECIGYTTPSNVYYSLDGERQLIIWSDFHLHLIPISDSITRVEVKPLNFRVIVGTEIFPRIGICGFYRPSIIKHPPPTTVEEYELLLKIGELLGEKRMPLIVIPNKQLISKRKNYE